MAHVAGLKSILAGTSILFIAVMFGNVLNYGYALVLGRFLGPEQYGKYASFMSLFLMLSLLPLTFQQIGAKYCAEGKSVARYTTKLALVLGGGMGIALAVFAQALEKLLNLPASWLIAFALCFPLYSLLGVFRGEVQGAERFALLGGNMILEPSSKILATVAIFSLAKTATGAVIATLLSLAFASLHLLRQWPQRVVSALERASVNRYAIPSFVNLCAQALIINVDLLIVNAFLPQEAGLYAAVALLGRVIFYGSWAIGAAIFPAVAKLGGREALRQQQLLWFAFAGVAMVCGGIIAFCALFPEFVLKLLVGSAYLGAAHMLAPYALMTSLYALSHVISNHYLALGYHRAGYLPFGGALFQTLLILLFHSSGMEVILVQIIAKASLR